VSKKYSPIFVLMIFALLAGCGGPAEEPEVEVTEAAPAPEAEPTPDEQVAGLERMCAEAGPAMTARQAEATLYDRVGGREGLRIVVEETVRRHLENEQIKHMFVGVDIERLEGYVTDFLVVGTGGEGEYHGRSMVDSHAHLEMTNADFLAAGGDLKAAMEGADWGEGEQQELLCAFVSLRGEVVTK
jgi:hemoglobin